MDRGVHRGTRLSIGFVRGDPLICPYHGWRYGEDGQCSFIPAHPDMKPAANLCLPRFAASEEGGLLWVSAGSPPSAPPNLKGFHYCRSLVVPIAPADLAAMIPSLRFGPSAALDYSVGEPEPGLVAITAADGGLAETRLIALQPEGEGSSVLHFLVAAGGGEAAARLTAAAQWVKRLRWFLTNGGPEVQSFNPWGREVCRQ